MIEVPTGTQVYDWIVPKEWRLQDAWIKNSRGEKIIDLANSNLHVVGYSTPVHATLTFSELKGRLHFLEKLPEAIPYRTSYYHEEWGFCLGYKQYQKYFREGETYEVCIESTLFDGAMTMGELLISGKKEKEYLVSSYICHPSMANDNLSGVLTAVFLARYLLDRQDTLEYSYRFVFVPETIGAIAYSALNESAMQKISEGVVMTTCGGPGEFGYKQSWQAEHGINALTESVFRERGIPFVTYPFEVRGSDERQYSSQGLRIDTVTITKDKYYEYDYYHTSLDDLDFVKAEYIEEALQLYCALFDKLDRRVLYRNQVAYGEVMLSRHDLYPKVGGAFNQLIEKRSGKSELDIILELLFYADGSRDLLELSQIIGVEEEIIESVAQVLIEKNILELC
jgi:aminopeptidase-like protein